MSAFGYGGSYTGPQGSQPMYGSPSPQRQSLDPVSGGPSLLQSQGQAEMGGAGVQPFMANNFTNPFEYMQTKLPNAAQQAANDLVLKNRDLDMMSGGRGWNSGANANPGGTLAQAFGAFIKPSGFKGKLSTDVEGGYRFTDPQSMISQLQKMSPEQWSRLSTGVVGRLGELRSTINPVAQKYALLDKQLSGYNSNQMNQFERQTGAYGLDSANLGNVSKGWQNAYNYLVNQLEARRYL